MQNEEALDKEYEPKRVMRDPGQPSKEEIEEHNLDHTPYRSWCPHCAKARGPDKPHRARRDPQEVPVFGFDYLSAKDMQLDEDGRKDEVKIIVAYCQATKCVFAHVIAAYG